ncbi:MAG: alpha-1,2-fucosyltransferase [Lachnospiraceae bacterium]|nr:alpha-1,2-fucosyltransferase [Lachnospiraceae bacterium]
MRSVVRISDGLGNQLFQYAFGYSFAQKTGQDIILDPFFWGSALRSYQLDKFRIRYTERFIDPIWDYILGVGPRNARCFKEKYRDAKIEKEYRLVRENKPMEYDSTVYDMRDAVYFQGFWQSPCYFDEFYDEIRRQFTIKGSLSGRAKDYEMQMGKENSVSLHIRRTDYDRDVNNVCLGGSFYEEALRGMEQSVGDFCLFLFTDDKEFVRKNFDLHEYILVEDISDIEEFVLMQRCRHHIVANSTFSWWGAYLAENKGGTVFAPVADIWTKEFYPAQWNLIRTRVGNGEGKKI